MEEQASLTETFHRYFEFIPAITQELREEAFKIRYEVYCEELGYENPDHFPDQLEQDCFDQNSLHYLLRHKSSQEFTACVRLAMVDSENKLPFEYTCGDSLYLDTVRPKALPNNSCVEISRLAVRSQFIKRSGEKNKPYSDDSPTQEFDERRTNYPLITYGLYMACFAGSLHHNTDNVFVMMETRLARRLRISGINFEQIGLAVEHRGKRAPYKILPKIGQHELSDDLQHLINDMRLVLTEAEPTMEYPVLQANG